MFAHEVLNVDRVLEGMSAHSVEISEGTLRSFWFGKPIRGAVARQVAAIVTVSELRKVKKEIENLIEEYIERAKEAEQDRKVDEAVTKSLENMLKKMDDDDSKSSSNN